MASLHRRDLLLRVGGFGLASVSLPTFLRASERSSRKAKARAVIFLHQFGGPSHHDTFDMKPNAPAEIRGEFTPIQSAAPGLMVCDRRPRGECAPRITRITRMKNSIRVCDRRDLGTRTK